MDSAYYNRGLAFADMGEFEKAIRDLNTIISRNSEDTGAYKSHGDVHLQQNKFDKAIRDYSKAIDLKSGSLFIYCDRAWVWLCLEEWEKAKNDLEVAESMEADIVAAFHRAHRSIADFERKNDIQVPDDIAKMLTQRSV